MEFGVMSHATGWRQQERELRVCDFRLRGAAQKIFPFVCARTQMRSATTGVHTKHMIQACTMDKEHNSSTSDGVLAPLSHLMVQEILLQP